VSGGLSPSGPVEIVAHRGYSARAPENTLVALKQAVEVGADALEFDLHVASDGTPHLFHDATLERTTDGEGRFRLATTEALARLDAGSWFDPAFAGEPVPTLSRVLDAVGGRVAKLYPEIKGYRTPDDVDTIVAIFVDSGLIDRTIFISMDWGALDRCRRTAPDACLGYIVESADRIDAGIERATGDPAALLDFDARLLLADPERAERASALSIPLAAWTVNRVADAARLLEMGVPRITTNEVEALLQWKARLQR
jgi:glycerophosphoryl diester phosphodiesterase